MENLIIIGGGAAGLSAAIYAAREGMNPLVIISIEPAGELSTASIVENYPGFPDGISGPDLIEKMRKQAVKFGSRIIYEKVTRVLLAGPPFTVQTELNTYQCGSIIIATGASPKWLGLPSEVEKIGRGVSSCATCDGPLYRNKVVAVVGGGDTALEYALILSSYSSKVYVVNRSPSLRGGRTLQDRIRSDRKIEVMLNTEVVEVLGDKKVSGISVRNKALGTTQNITCDGLFIAIGERPNTDFLMGQLKLDPDGYVVTTDEVKTGIPGVYCAGDIVDKIYRQAVTAAASGVKAFFEARRFLQESGAILEGIGPTASGNENMPRSFYL
ncbi:MAG: thioredoxin-disulfide reductase [Thermoplasmataceae archaeon]